MVPIHNRNRQILVKGIFGPQAEHRYNLGCISQFSAPLVSTVFHGAESISFFGS